MHDDATARLVLDDGREFDGVAFGATRAVSGEVVFTTGLAGYPESLTDPSFRGQILVMTYPLIGNYGVPARTATNGILDHFESDRIQVSGLVVSWLSRRPSHWSAAESLDDWLRREGVPAIEGVDTRSLTQHLRARGVMGGRLEPRDAVTMVESSCDMQNVVSAVSVDRPRWLRSDAAGPTLGVLDCGVKNNMLRLLLERGCNVVRLPWDADPMAVMPRIDGLLISNGPGDPKDVPGAVAATRRVLEHGLPTFGICFGNQLVALAAGADTFKLPYGHRGQNQPCIDLDSGRCYITSQNHGYAVDESTLPAGWSPWFRNANDGTNEGIRHESMPFRSVQFHPEAYPGPEDLRGMVDDFLADLG